MKKKLLSDKLKEAETRPSCVEPHLDQQGRHDLGKIFFKQFI